jgi:hypothetical protein
MEVRKVFSQHRRVIQLVSVYVQAGESDQAVESIHGSDLIVTEVDVFETLQPAVGEVNCGNLVPPDSQLEQAIHLVHSTQTVDLVVVCTNLSQMDKPSQSIEVSETITRYVKVLEVGEMVPAGEIADLVAAY